MGKKYASIHIYTDNPDELLSIVISIYNNDKSMESKLKQAVNLFKNAEVKSMFERQFRLSLPEILIIQSDKFISIYDENLSFETIEAKTKALSEKVDRPIIYASNFDDDVFILGIYRSGNLITSSNVGEGLLMYDIIPESLDIDKFCNQLDIKKTNLMNCFTTSEMIEEIEDEIEDILQVPLELSYDDIWDDSEQFIEKTVEGKIHVFKKI